MPLEPNGKPRATDSHGAQPDSIRWLFTVRNDDGTSRDALGTRDSVASVLGECLPRLSVDSSGSSTFTRGSAELRIHLVGEPVRVIELTMRPAHVAAFRSALERVAARGNWQFVDPDRHEVLFPPREGVGAGSRRAVVWWAAAVLAAAGLIAVAAGWVPIWRRGDEARPATRAAEAAGASDPVSAAAGFPANAPGPMGGGEQPGVRPMSIEEFTAQAQLVGRIMRQQRTLATEFRGLRVVNELLMIRTAEFAFQGTVGNGQYIDPARLADPAIVPSGMGIIVLSPQYASQSRGGYRFTFTGIGEPGQPFFEQFSPTYHEFICVASPEPGQPSTYTFAILSTTGKIHYTTDGRVPSESDPSVTDAVATEAPKVMEEIESSPDENGLMRGLRNLINNFIRSKPAQDAKLAYHEDRAIGDLRTFAAAQEALVAMVSGQGYGTPEVLSDPSILPGQPSIPPLVDRSFVQQVREGYRFTFAGRQLTVGNGRAALYGDYTYSAVPVGDGPSTRRSFAVTSDGLIRFRTDGAPPETSDQILGSER